MAKIEWTQRDYSESGKVGELVLFTVGYQSQGRHYVRTWLPGFKRDINRPSNEEAKALCEKMLDRFLERIGAEWRT